MSGKKKKKKTSSQNVKIYARVRSLMPWEPRQVSLRVLGSNRIRNKTVKTENEYSFTKVFGTDIQNPYIFKVIVQPMIDNVLKGFNAVLIAYGQTGSGKTFSMLGKPNLGVIGLLPMMLQTIVETPTVFKLELSAVEAFGHHVARIELFDLYQPHNQVPRWNEKKGNTSQEMDRAVKKEIKDLDQAYEMIKYAHAASHFAPTGKNPESSRGHVTFVAKIHQNDPGGGNMDLISFFVMLDCAGSEGESAFTKAFIESVDKQTLLARRLEAGTINTGLSSLQIIFNELRIKGKLSKVIGNGLRRVLHPYINTQTFLAVLFTFSPSVNNAKATESTLKFAVTAGMVKVAPVKAQLSVNVEKLVQQLRAMIKKNDITIDEQMENLTDAQADLVAIKQDAMTAGMDDYYDDSDEDDDGKTDGDGKRRRRRRLADNILAKLDYLDEESEEEDYVLDDMFATDGSDAGAMAALEAEMEAAFARMNQDTDETKAVKDAVGYDDDGKELDAEAAAQKLSNTIEAGQRDVLDIQYDENGIAIDVGDAVGVTFIDYDALQLPELVDHCKDSWTEIEDTTAKQEVLKQTQKEMVGHLSDTNEWLFAALGDVLNSAM
jgi:hypothetical protein